MKQSQFKPTKEMIAAAETLFLAMAYEQTVRPKVLAYQQAILQEKAIYPDAKYQQAIYEGSVPHEPITDPERLYLATDEDARYYFDRCDQEKVKAGFPDLGEGFCPLLMAETQVRDAQTMLVRRMEPITKMTKDDLLCSRNGLENYKKLIEITMNLLRPYVRTSQQILADVLA